MDLSYDRLWNKLIIRGFLVNVVVLGWVSVRALRFSTLFFHQWSILSAVTIGVNEPIFFFGVVARETDLVLRQSRAFWGETRAVGRELFACGCYELSSRASFLLPNTKT